MAYWVSVCQSDTDPGVLLSGPGRGSVNCLNADGTSANQTVQLESIQGTSLIALMSPEESVQVAGAIAVVWAGAWGIRLLAKFLSHEERYQDE